MRSARDLAFLAVLLGLTLTGASEMTALAQEAEWSRHMMAATAALKRRDYADSEAELIKALAIAEGFGDRDPRFARTLHNLGYIFRAEGRLKLAEPLYLRALTIQESVLGPNHADVALTLNNLAGLYREMGDLEKAEPLYRRSLATRERALGAAHPDVGDSLNNLAGLLRLVGRHAEAEEYAQRAIAVMEKALGRDNTKVATWLYNLSRLYLEQGRFEEAAKFEARARAIWIGQAGGQASPAR